MITSLSFDTISVKKDYNLYECINEDQKVKIYLDIDDVGSESLEESEKYLEQMICDFKKLYNITENPLKITAHGFCKNKNKNKFSYTLIFTNYHFLSTQHAKKAVNMFLTEFSTYTDIVDTLPYMKFQTLRRLKIKK